MRDNLCNYADIQALLRAGSSLRSYSSLNSRIMHCSSDDSIMLNLIELPQSWTILSIAVGISYKIEIICSSLVTMNSDFFVSIIIRFPSTHRHYSKLSKVPKE